MLDIDEVSTRESGYCAILVKPPTAAAYARSHARTNRVYTPGIRTERARALRALKPVGEGDVLRVQYEGCAINEAIPDDSETDRIQLRDGATVMFKTDSCESAS